MQETQTALKNISLKPSNANRIALFVGELNGNLKLIEKINPKHKDEIVLVLGEKIQDILKEGKITSIEKAKIGQIEIQFYKILYYYNKKK